MAHDATLYTALAAILEYPDDDFELRLRRCRRDLGGRDLGECIEPLAGFFAAQGLDAAQELYTATFDLSPVCCLDVGWHLYGESYTRGALLVGLRGEMRRHGVSETTELPDHLPDLMRLLAAMPDGEEADLLRDGIVLPAVGKMTGALGSAANPYAAMMRGVASALGAQIERAPVKLPVWRGEESRHG